MSKFTVMDEERGVVDLYILKDRKVVAAELLEWARWFENFDNRLVARWELGGVEVSTVFLGINHNLFGDGPPLVFETMTFDLDGRSEIIDRYSTWDEAEAGHMRACEEQRKRAKA